MAEINAAIPMSYQFGPTIGEHFQNAVKLADAMDQRKERALDMDAKRQAMAQRAAMNPLQVQQAQQNIAAGQQEYNQRELTNPLTYEKMLEEHNDLLQKRKNENLEIMARAAESVIDEPSYQAWKKFADTQVGGDTSDLPSTYNEDAKMQIANVINGYSAKEQQKKDFEIKMQTLKEISALPDGAEKDQKFAQFMLSAAPAAFYPTSPQGINAAVKKIKETAEPEAEAAGKKAFAQEAGKEATAGGKIEIDKKLREEQDAAAKAEAARTAAKEYEQNTLSRIDGLISKIESGETRTGMTADAWAKFITSSKAATQKAYFDQIKNNLTVQKLLDIKAQGGTFGALSEKELELLTKSASNLDFAGSKQRNLDALREIRNTIMKVKARSGGKSTISDADADALLNKYRQ